MEEKITLTTAQESAAGELLRGIRVATVVVLKSSDGMGRTATLRHVRASAVGASSAYRRS